MSDFFSNTLSSPLQWLLIGSIPLFIVLLYFLKLKRTPLEVPSTYLWSRTIEDLHVNSIWQRLRQSLLLLLQILLIVLFMLALMRPSVKGTVLDGRRFIFVMDTSASMHSTDDGEDRMSAAREACRNYIKQLEANQIAMLITCNDRAQVEMSYSQNMDLLLQRINEVKATARRSDLTEALQYASGLANPTFTRLDGRDLIDESKPATLVIFSDGGVKQIDDDFAPGSLTVDYEKIGNDLTANVAIIAFATTRNREKPGKLSLFGSLENFSDEDADVTVQVWNEGELVKASSELIPKNGVAGVEFEVPDFDFGTLELKIAEADGLALDNSAISVVNRPRKANVLLVTPDNNALTFALSTSEALRVAEVRTADPSVIGTEDHENVVGTGAYDLIIYDQCVPEKMPQANTLIIGNLPPVEGWAKNDNTGPPIVIDVDQTHPLMHLVNTNVIRAFDGFGIKMPDGGSVLLDADIGPIIGIAPREGFQDLATGFPLIRDGDWVTDWPLRRSFPVFIMNLVRHLGGGNAGEGDNVSIQPGESITLRTSEPVSDITIETPSGKEYKILENAQNAFVFTATEELGLYKVFPGDLTDPRQLFAVNLFDRTESDVRAKQLLELNSAEQFKAKDTVTEKRKDYWKYVLILGMLVLMFEWYIYNRRVYM